MVRRKSFDPRRVTEKVRNVPNKIDTHMFARIKSDEPLLKTLWRIMSIKEEGIALSGPGPCRTYQVVDHDTFDKEWNVIWCRSPSGMENEYCHMKYCGYKKNVLTCTFCGRDTDWNVVEDTYFKRMAKRNKL